MAVKSKKEGEKLILELDNGDYQKLEDAMKKWSFKDHQSLLRFAVSLFLLNEDKNFTIKMEGSQSQVTPVKDLLKESGV